jgi:hypothetical protein
MKDLLQAIQGQDWSGLESQLSHYFADHVVPPLHAAVLASWADAIPLLASACTDVDEQFFGELTANVMELLAAQGCPIGEPSQGVTPLGLATAQASTSCMTALLRAGADPGLAGLSLSSVLQAASAEQRSIVAARPAEEQDRWSRRRAGWQPHGFHWWEQPEAVGLARAGWDDFAGLEDDIQESLQRWAEVRAAAPFCRARRSHMPDRQRPPVLPPSPAVGGSLDGDLHASHRSSRGMATHL